MKAIVYTEYAVLPLMLTYDGVTDLELQFVLRKALKPEFPITPSGADRRREKRPVRPCLVSELVST